MSRQAANGNGTQHHEQRYEEFLSMRNVGRRSVLGMAAGAAGLGVHPRTAAAVEYLAPGVYVEEVPGGARPISAVGTSTAAIFGVAPAAAASLRTPTFVTSFREYGQVFATGQDTSNVLSNAVAGFFQNGGSRCLIVNLGDAGRNGIVPDDLLLIDALDEISLVLAPGYADAGSYEALIGDCERRGDRFAILDTPRDIDPLDRLTRVVGSGDGLRPRSSIGGYAAVYTPWIEIHDATTRDWIDQPPSGHLAGVYARTDATRGVHKAPANVPLIGALGLTRQIGRAEQGLLNPVGVNVIRQFSHGFRVWGARTLAESTSEWRYVPVRRLATMITQSIERGTRWVIFEPNDEPLWAAVRRDVGAFLHTMWRDGTLQGAKEEEAYFVRCGRDTMTQADIDAGRVIVAIGIAPLRPAEFSIARITQSAAGTRID